MTDCYNPTDRMSVVTCSDSVKLLLESTLASDANAIQPPVPKLGTRASRSGGEALKMAYEETLANYIEGGNNSVIMGDGRWFQCGSHFD